ncbi:scarecrow-like protein 14 [Andrographis paniculata]|uniref:scarecrow-like protein 14 n=1 Tax=Andrographis paniculata TaxID=175694 RepID=UPI0021E920CB|nr:scarecrow-like protein 14 [Andrographis paniculata]
MERPSISPMAGVSSFTDAGSANNREEALVVPCDYFHGVIDYINQMVMEEEEEDDHQLEASFCLLHDTENHLRDLLSSDPSPSSSAAAANDNQKNHRSGGEDDDGVADTRKGKLSATYYYYADEEHDEMEKFDKLLLCRRMNPGFYDEVPVTGDEIKVIDGQHKSMRQYWKTTVPKRGRPKGSRSRKNNNTNTDNNNNAEAVKEVAVDLRSLLSRAAQAVSESNTAVAGPLLSQIRHHSSPYGDQTERLAHCFANALDARLAGTGSAMFAAYACQRITTAELMRSYKTYVQASPFQRMSNVFANKSIGRYANKATRIHIIDFGISYGLQWPCIIQGFSLRPGGSPLVRITGIDFPQPGFKPAERVEQAGRRLMSYARRFNVPLEYTAIAKRWEDITVEELRIRRGETVVVNCMYRLRHAYDESAGVNTPARDEVLKLIKRINPGLFVHGVVNGSYNAAFFVTRFREALHNYTSFFDMLESTLPSEDQERVMFEREVLGGEVMNVVACEGAARIERPETYKQWQARNRRAGFQQVALDREILKEVAGKVRREYHSNFLLDEDSGWMLQGWKGRVMYALSCWRPGPTRPTQE